MFRVSKNLAVLFVIFATTFVMVAPQTVRVAPAQVVYAEEIERENSDITKMFHKLGRGVLNVLTGWVEIPKQTAKEWRRTDPFTGTVLGVVKGVVFAVARTFAGFYEIISFPFPVPRNYEPIMQPEFVLPTVWGERLPLYRDEFTGGSGSIDRAIDYGTTNPTAGSPSRTY